jgi:XTP/dITP diphosphohydrolase
MADFIIEDSGLFIDPLGGFPGVYSSYILKTLGNPGILRLLGDRKDRDAVFRSCFGHFSTHRGPALIKGECKGRIAFEQRGKEGFGFDPIFIPDGEERTFAEMSVEEKNSISHRGRALEALYNHLQRR